MSRLATGAVATVALGFLGTLAAPAASAESGSAIVYDLRGEPSGGGSGDLLGLGGLLDSLLSQDGLVGGLLNDVGNLLNGLL